MPYSLVAIHPHKRVSGSVSPAVNNNYSQCNRASKNTSFKATAKAHSAIISTYRAILHTCTVVILDHIIGQYCRPGSGIYRSTRNRDLDGAQYTITASNSRWEFSYKLITNSKKNLNSQVRLFAGSLHANGLMVLTPFASRNIIRRSRFGRPCSLAFPCF